jgi:hypothetical protein
MWKELIALQDLQRFYAIVCFDTANRSVYFRNGFTEQINIFCIIVDNENNHRSGFYRFRCLLKRPT